VLTMSSSEPPRRSFWPRRAATSPPSRPPSEATAVDYNSTHEKTTPQNRTPSDTPPSQERDPEDIPASNYSGPPPLNFRINGTRERYAIIFFALIFVETCILPLILFYSLRWGAHLSATKNLAIITSLVGTVSGIKLAQRTYFLWVKTGHESRRPIGAGRWGVDFFHIVINVALFGFFTPLIIGSSLTPASVPVVAMALPCFMLVMCIPMLISGLFPNHFRMPFRVSSFQPGHVLPPLTYTIVEDVVAVDGGGLLEFRQAWRSRYEASRVMRKLMRDISLLWGISGCVLAAGLIAIAWTTAEDVGYGLGYSMPWLWAMVLTVATIVRVKLELEREAREWDDTAVHKEKPLHLKEKQVDRDAYERMLQTRRRSTSVVRRVQTMPDQSAGGMSVGHVMERSATVEVPSPEDEEERGRGRDQKARDGKHVRIAGSDGAETPAGEEANEEKKEEGRHEDAPIPRSDSPVEDPTLRPSLDE